MTKITAVEVLDVRFPTSATLDGSDAMSGDSDYSATYVRLVTDDPELVGTGLTFTAGRGNDLVVRAAELQSPTLVGRDVDDMRSDLGGVYRDVSFDNQLRWLGPEKGVIHLSAAALMNAVWDLVARAEGKPVWQLVADMDPEDLVDVLDLRYVTDVLTRDDALEMLRAAQPGKQARLADLERDGYPAYATSPGWLGYSDAKMSSLAGDAIADGFTHIKLKVGANLEDDRRRCALARRILGDEGVLLIDANQVWDVDEAIEWLGHLKEFRPLFIEEPTSPDDAVGHARIRAAVAPMRVATGEVMQNRILFKQFFALGALDYAQADTGRLASINEILTVLLLAAKFEIPVWPHAGGVGLCNMVAHVVMIDHLLAATTTQGRAEWIDHLHEHFVDPPRVTNAHYDLPQAPGYGTELKAATIEQFEFPHGSYSRAHG